MQVFLIFCLLVSAAVYAARRVCDTYRKDVPFSRALLICAVCTAAVGIPAVLLVSAARRVDDMLLFLVVATFAGAVWVSASWFGSNRGRAPKLWLWLMILYLAVLFVVTLFRTGDDIHTEVIFSLKKFRKLFTEGSPEGVIHVVLNIAMLAPFGFLLCAVNGGPIHPAYVFSGGLWISSLIESIQYLFALGECDLEDVLGNVIGALLGLVFYKILIRYTERSAEKNS
ncbi:MAG: VanZ family protein [Clostridia bacterium]|nr:VanZ family protein [Clostridia bacterium]